MSKPINIMLPSKIANHTCKQQAKEIKRLHSIIKEVRKYIEKNINENEAKFYGIPDYKVFKGNIEHVLEILDKENK